MSGTIRRYGDKYSHRPGGPRSTRQEKDFRCSHCKAMVFPVRYGGSHRNHCPFCLYSKHVDGRVPGDRASECGGAMAPIGAFARPNGELAVVHRCLSCRFERYNRIAADDFYELVLSLPAVPARPVRERSEDGWDRMTA